MLNGASLSVGGDLVIGEGSGSGNADVEGGTVTVAGQIQPGTDFNPARIAEAFWSLHADPAGQFRNEIIFAPTPAV